MGNAAKGGMEIYTPVHMDWACATFPGCNLRGGYNFDVVNGLFGCTELWKLMQNGLENNWNWNTDTMKICVIVCMMNVFRQLDEEGELRFLELKFICNLRFSGLQMNLEMSFWYANDF